MNLVKGIMDQLSGDSLGQLSSLLGADHEVTERATHAAVPAMLSALAGMTSNEIGTKKLMNALSGLDTGGLGNIAQMLGGNAGSLLNKGTGLLGSLFGDGMVSAIANAISRLTGLNAGLAKSLLAYLLPLVLGKVAAQWKNQGGTSQALTSLFSSQRDNIANALPAGLSLADIPGLSDPRKAAHSYGRNVEAEPVTGGSPARWLLPLALALLGGFLLWQFMSRPRALDAATDKAAETVEGVRQNAPTMPAIDVPNLTSVRDNLGGLFTSMDTAFSDIRDAASGPL